MVPGLAGRRTGARTVVQRRGPDQFTRTIRFDINAVALRLDPVPACRTTLALMRPLRFSSRRPVGLMSSSSCRVFPFAPDSSAVARPSSLPLLPPPRTLTVTRQYVLCGSESEQVAVFEKFRLTTADVTF